jgi:ABC-type antimicrobial peptide transport system permease subunit
MRELGLRMAFGASRSNILTMVIRRALLLGLGGIIAGAVASTLGSKLVSSQLVGVQPLDPWVFLVVTLVLLAVSVVAAMVPALRAAYVNPMRTLREE